MDFKIAFVSLVMLSIVTMFFMGQDLPINQPTFADMDSNRQVDDWKERFLLPWNFKSPNKGKCSSHCFLSLHNIKKGQDHSPEMRNEKIDIELDHLLDPENETALNLLDHYKEYSRNDKFTKNFHKPFVFLSVINWDEDKKLMEYLIESYLKEFKHRERVLLLILIEDHKSTTIHQHLVQLHKKITTLPENAEIWISNDYFTPHLLKRLYKSSNCYVVPSKKLSFHHLSSMLLGIPIIIEKSKENSFLIDEDVSFVEHNDRPFLWNLGKSMRKYYINKNKPKTVDLEKKMKLVKKYEFLQGKI